MAGRLEQYAGFEREAQNNATQVKPKKEQDSAGEEFDGAKSVIALSLSRKHGLLCYVFYTVKSERRNERIYRLVVVPRHSLTNWGKKYIEVIDVRAMRRKIFKIHNISKVKLTEIKPGFNQEAIGFKK